MQAWQAGNDGGGKRTGHASKGELEVLWQRGLFRGLRHDAVGAGGADQEGGKSAGSVRVRVRTRVGRATRAMSMTDDQGSGAPGAAPVWGGARMPPLQRVEHFDMPLHGSRCGRSWGRDRAA